VNEPDVSRGGEPKAKRQDADRIAAKERKDRKEGIAAKGAKSAKKERNEIAQRVQLCDTPGSTQTSAERELSPTDFLFCAFCAFLRLFLFFLRSLRPFATIPVSVSS
jgi:hypothetical protein